MVEHSKNLIPSESRLNFFFQAADNFTPDKSLEFGFPSSFRDYTWANFCFKSDDQFGKLLKQSKM